MLECCRWWCKCWARGQWRWTSGNAKTAERMCCANLGTGLCTVKWSLMIMGACSLKHNRIDYSHRICVWPSEKEKKRNVSLWTPYTRVAVICIWGEEEVIKRPNWWGRGVLFWEQRADIELRGVGASCRVVLFWELVQAA